MQHHAHQHRQQQRAGGAQLHRAALVAYQHDAGIQQRRSRQPVAIAQTALQHIGQKRQQNGVHVKVRHQHTQSQQQAHDAADDPRLGVIGGRRRGGAAFAAALGGAPGVFLLWCIRHSLPHLMALSSSVSRPAAQQ